MNKYEEILTDLNNSIWHKGQSIANIIDSCAGEVQGRLSDISSSISNLCNEIRETNDDLADSVFFGTTLHDFFYQYGHELALSLKNAMREESLTVNVELASDELNDLAFHFDRIASVLEKLEEKL